MGVELGYICLVLNCFCYTTNMVVSHKVHVRVTPLMKGKMAELAERTGDYPILLVSNLKPRETEQLGQDHTALKRQS